MDDSRLENSDASMKIPATTWESGKRRSEDWLACDNNFFIILNEFPTRTFLKSEKVFFTRYKYNFDYINDPSKVMFLAYSVLGTTSTSLSTRLLVDFGNVTNMQIFIYLKVSIFFNRPFL